MDFARKQMEKYGWKEGQGLGKNETGITNALKPKLKNNNNGLGFVISEEFTNNWWDKLYKKASDNVSVTETAGEVKLSQVGPDSFEISDSEYKFNKDKKGVEKSFIKASKFGEFTSDYGVDAPLEYMVSIPTLTDVELLKACGGRTAHKGARHGLHLSGKLARIEKQEKILLKQMRRISLNDETDPKVEKKCKKLEKLKTCDKLDKNDDEKLSKKKKKKKRKSVSFSRAIAEVIPETEADSSFNSEDRLGYESSSAGPPSPYPHSSRSRSSSPLSLSSTSSPKPKTSRSSSPYLPNVLPSPQPTTTTLSDEGIEQDFPQSDNYATNYRAKKNGKKSSVSIKSSARRESVSEVVLNDHLSFEERSDELKLDDATEFVALAPLGDEILSKAEKKLKIKKMRATERFLAVTLQVPNAPCFGAFNGKQLKSDLKRKKEKLEDTDGTEIDKRYFKKTKSERKQEKVVNKIAKGLEKVCKITDGDEDRKKTTKKVSM